MLRICNDILEVCFGFLGAADLFRLSCSERRLRDMVCNESKVWDALAHARWPDGPYRGILRLQHIHGIGIGRCNSFHQLGICEHTEVIEACNETVACVSAQFVCIWKTNGMHARIPCLYLAPATTYKPHVAIIDDNMFAVSIGPGVEFSRLTGGRTYLELPCTEVIWISRGPRGAIIVTDFGAVWHCECRDPGTHQERTHSARVFVPCVLAGRPTGPATCAAYHDFVYYYGTTQGLYREGPRDIIPVCLARGAVTSVVANEFGMAAACDNKILIFHTGRPTHTVHPWYVTPGNRMHLFKDLLMCGPITINMNSLQISQVDACEYAVGSGGTISVTRTGTRAVVACHGGHGE